jgi:hypothetical protein
MDTTYLESGYNNYRVWLRRANTVTGGDATPVSKRTFHRMLQSAGKEGSVTSGPVALVVRKAFFDKLEVGLARRLSLTVGSAVARIIRAEATNVASAVAEEVTKLSHNRYELPPAHRLMEAVDVVNALLIARRDEKATPNMAEVILRKVN